MTPALILIQFRPCRICYAAPFGLPLPSSAFPSQNYLSIWRSFCALKLCSRPNFRDSPGWVFLFQQHPGWQTLFTAPQISGTEIFCGPLSSRPWDLSFSESVQLQRFYTGPGFFIERCSDSNSFISAPELVEQHPLQLDFQSYWISGLR